MKVNRLTHMKYIGNSSNTFLSFIVQINVLLLNAIQRVYSI